MQGNLIIIWDYDAAIGQVNATYPYNFNEERLFEEIEHVETILKFGQECEIRMTFACLGFAAEPGQFPYHVPDQIRKIHSLGHEIASHSWKHEWFPYLQREQILRSLARSKFSLETCIGQSGAVQGFVPPFSRPMSWYRKGAISLGDRVFGRWYPGADLGSLIKIVRQTGYAWCRVAYRPLWRRLFPEKGLNDSWEKEQGVACVPHHYAGFDETALALVKRAIEEEKTVVISGHPSGLGRNGNESLECVRSFLHTIARDQEKGILKISTVSRYVELFDESINPAATGRVVSTSC